MDKSILEYIWINNDKKFMSKIRILDLNYIQYITQIPEWNYNDISTYGTFNIEFILKPCFYCKNYFNEYNSYIVLCDAYDGRDNPLINNKRYVSNIILNSINYNKMNYDTCPNFGFKDKYYFTSYDFKNSKNIIEEHLKACLYANITIFGINFDLILNQYVFKIGPCIGINAVDQLIIARYLLEKISEKYNILISYDLKCYINFSTCNTREENGLEVIHDYMHKLQLKIYSYNDNSFNLRIPIKTLKDKCGYFDCNILSDIDPYITTSFIYKTCCLD